MERIDLVAMRTSLLEEYYLNTTTAMFLGFGFSDENCKTIDVHSLSRNSKQVKSTSYDLTRHEIKVVTSRTKIDESSFDGGYDCLHLLRNNLGYLR
jgi:hypothetical protein